MKVKSLSLVLVLLAAFVWVTPASANQATCTGAGGTWEGTNANNGECTYASSSATAIGACGSDTFPYVVTYEFGAEVSARCAGRNGSGATSNGAVAETFTLTLPAGKNGWVNFPADTCNINCTINAQIPQTAKADLGGPTLATLYVRLDGGFGTGSYQVCFENPYGASRTIYQFTGGTWWPIARGTGTTICGTASGDSAFYLGGKP
jgi:hypothetical protein